MFDVFPLKAAQLPQELMATSKISCRGGRGVGEENCATPGMYVNKSTVCPVPDKSNPHNHINILQM